VIPACRDRISGVCGAWAANTHRPCVVVVDPDRKAGPRAPVLSKTRPVAVVLAMQLAFLKGRTWADQQWPVHATHCTLHLGMQ
jgi:hypothetical protein